MRRRVAVLGRTGQGNYGHQLDVAFHDQARADIVAVADPDPAGAKATADRLGAARTYQDHRKLLECEEPDIVVVAPRHMDCHAEWVCDALEAGAHVYCEKPLAQDLEQADRMVETADRTGRRLGVALPFVHEPRFATMMRLLGEGLIGNVVQYRALCKFDHRGGGQDFLILGVHFADMLRRLAGDPLTCVARVSAQGRPLRIGDRAAGLEQAGPVAGDEIVASYEFPQRRLGTIESWRLGIEDRARQPYRLEIHGTRGVLAVRAPYADHSIWHYPRPVVDPAEPAWERVPTEPISPYGAYHQLAASDFLDALEQDRDPACSGADGRAALEMILAAYESELTTGVVTFPLADRRHPLTRD